MRYLEKIGGVYRVRLRIPKDVKRHFVQREIRKSLHTTRYGQAKVLLFNLLSETERIFTMIRAGVLSDDMIRKIVADYLDMSVDSFERQRNGEGNEFVKAYDAELSNIIAADFGHDMTVKAMGFLNDYKRKAVGRRKAQEIDGIVEVARHYIEFHKLDITPGSVEFERLCNELLKADIQAEGIVLEHLQGNYETDYDRDLDKRKNVKTLKELIALYERDKAEGWTDKSRLKSTHRQILHILGNVPLSAIDRQTCVGFRDALKEYPCNPKELDMIKNWRELAKVKKRRLSESTQRFVMVELCSLLKYGKEHDLGIKGSPAAGMVGKKDKIVTVKNRVPLTVEELDSLVKVLATVDRVKESEWFWLPLLLLFTGARSNEACMLRSEDIEQLDNDLWLIHFRNRPEYHQKTKNGKDRQTPVHNALLKLGLAEYVESQKLAGKDRLFDNLVLWQGKWNKYFGKDYNRTFKRRFLPEYSKEQLTGKDLHTFRHTFTSWFVQRRDLATVPNISILQSMIGHFEAMELTSLMEFLGNASLTINNYGGGYGKAHEQNVLLQKLDYGIDWTPLSIGFEF